MRYAKHLLAVGSLLTACHLSLGQVAAPAQQGNTQSAGTNKGVMIQNNVKVNVTVQKILRERAKTVFGDANGWLGVLTPDNDTRPVWDPPAIAGQCREPFPPGDLIVVLGRGYMTRCAKDVCSVIPDKTPNADTKSLLSVERKGGLLAINANIFDDQGKIVGRSR